MNYILAVCSCLFSITLCAINLKLSGSTALLIGPRNRSLIKWNWEGDPCSWVIYHRTLVIAWCSSSFFYPVLRETCSLSPIISKATSHCLDVCWSHRGKIRQWVLAFGGASQLCNGLERNLLLVGETLSRCPQVLSWSPPTLGAARSPFLSL